MPHPNQLALVEVAEAWIAQSQPLPDHEAAERLQAKVCLLQDKIHLLSLAAAEDREPDDSVVGLSAIDLMAAQCRLAVEARVRRRFAALRQAQSLERAAA